MVSVIQLVVAVVALGVFAWMMVSSPTSTLTSSQGNNELIDPNDTRQLATLMGLAGGDITDAAIARFAIQRFQEQHGRAPTTQDIATVVAIMRSL